MSCVLQKIDLFASRALVSTQQAFVADVLPFGGLGEDAGKRFGIAKAQIDAVSGERMNAVSRVADQGEAWGNDFRDAHQTEGECRRRGDEIQVAEDMRSRRGDARRQAVGRQCS